MIEQKASDCNEEERGDFDGNALDVLRRCRVEDTDGRRVWM